MGLGCKKQNGGVVKNNRKGNLKIKTKKGMICLMSRFEKIKKAVKRTTALALSSLMAATCVNASVLTANAAASTLSNEERGVIFANTRTDFRDESIYFVMTTRFYNGDTSNDTQCWEVDPESGTYKANYEADDPAWRGDFKGLIEKLDYIKALGFSAVWITPVVENCSGYDYHGYHALNFKKVDPRYESSDCTYQDLIDAVHGKGMKLIQDVVYNHSGNFGETNLCNMFVKEGDLSKYTCLKLAPNSPLPSDYFSLTPSQQYQTRLKMMKDPNYDINNYYHHEPNFNWDDYTCQIAQIADDCVDLNTENPLVYNYLVEAYSNYIKMGVDAFRVDTVRHISRLTLNKAFNQQLIAASKTPEAVANRNGYDFFMFGEVCCRHTGGVWYRDNPGMSTPFYTWKESKDYAWSEDPADWETNYNSSIQCSKDNANNIGEQPTSNNAFLNGNEYHTPDYSKFSGLSTIDFPMHWCFREASGAFNMALGGDKYYNDCTWNVTYVDSHDYAPDNAPENQRFSGSQDTWAENLSLIFTFRGIPCIYYGSEIEFQKGQLIDKGPLIKLSESGRAYFGDYLEGDIVTSDFTVFNASGNVAETLKHPLAQHIIRLNRIRQAIPALRKGQYSTDGCSGSFAFKRRYTGNGVDSFALVCISGGATFSGIPNGTYVDAVTGDTKTVSNGTLTATCSGKGNLRVYVLNGPGRIVPNGAYITDGGSAELIGNANVNVVKPTGISLSSTSATVREAETVSLKATVAPSNATNKTVTWTSSNTSVATVSGGTVTGISKGTVKITAKTWNGFEATCTVTVTENTSIIKPTGITMTTQSLELIEGETGNLSATVAPSNATNKTITWTSGDTTIATVNASGQVTAVKEGTVTITAATFNGYKATATVTVTPKQFKTIDHGVYFEKPSGWSNAYVYLFDSATNSTVGASWPGTKMTDMGEDIYCYEYSNPTSTLMLVFNSGDGKQTADLEYVDCGYYTQAGYKKTIEKQDNVDVTSVSVSKSSVSVKKGETATVTATVSPSNATNKTITWTSSNTSVATVSGGVITGVKAGTATITAKSNNGKTATVSVTVTEDSVVTALANNSTISATSVAAGGTIKLTAKATGGTSPYLYTYRYRKSGASSWTTLGSSNVSGTTKSFSIAAAGTYEVAVLIKDSTLKVVSKVFNVTVGSSSALANNSTISATSVAAGGTIKLTAKATGGTSPHLYTYRYRKSSATSWKTVGSSNVSSTTKTFTIAEAGTYEVAVLVKDSTSKVVSKVFTVTVTGSSALANSSTISATSVTLGNAAKVTAKVTGGTAPYNYTYQYKSTDSSTWTTVGTKNTTTTTSNIKPTAIGTYDVRVVAKDSTGKAATKKFTLKVTAASTSAALTNSSKLSSASVSKGTKVTLYGVATGGTSPYTYAYYYKKSTATSWTILGTEYGSAATATLTPAATGTYNIMIKVRDKSGEIVSKSFALTVS